MKAKLIYAHKAEIKGRYIVELPYEFSSDEKLVFDFEKLVLDHMGVKL